MILCMDMIGYMLGTCWIFGRCHAKRSLMVWVVVIPKVGWACIWRIGTSGTFSRDAPHLVPPPTSICYFLPPEQHQHHKNYFEYWSAAYQPVQPVRKLQQSQAFIFHFFKFNRNWDGWAREYGNCPIHLPNAPVSLVGKFSQFLI